MADVKYVEHLAVFADVCRDGSFSAAARRRSVTPSSIIRQIDRLEAELGVTLLTRSTRALALTSAGQLLLERGQRILEEVVDTRAEIAALDGAVAGVLRIACLPTFGRRYVMPVMETLMAEHPALRVELDLTERVADPVAERLDVVIRIGTLQDSTLIATKIAPQVRLLVASPHYLEQFGRPDSVSALAGHRLLDKIQGTNILGWSDLLGKPIQAFAADQDFFRCDDFEVLRNAAVRGFGIGLLPSWVVGEDIAAGTLLPLLPEAVCAAGGGGAIYVLRALAAPPAKVRTFITALRNRIGLPPVWDRACPDLGPPLPSRGLSLAE